MTASKSPSASKRSKGLHRGLNSAPPRQLAVVASALLAAAGTFKVYVWLLQTPVISGSRLALAASIFILLGMGHYFIAARWMARRQDSGGPSPLACVLNAIVLTAVFLPILYRAPTFPRSPLLRPWTEIAVQVELSSSSIPVLMSPDDLKLAANPDYLNAMAFRPVGNWQQSVAGRLAAPGSTVSLHWSGAAASTMELTVQPHPAADGVLTIYWDGQRIDTRLGNSHPDPLVVHRKFDLPAGFVVADFFSVFILLAWALSILGLHGHGFWLHQLNTTPGRAVIWIGGLLAVALAALTVALQLTNLPGGLEFLDGGQWALHSDVLHGRAPDPWQYRLFAEYAAEALVRLAGSIGVQSPIGAGFIFLRLIQNTAILICSLALYRRMGSPPTLALLGMLVLAASMANAFYDSDLSFNTYFDVLAYLLAGLLLLARRYWATVPLTLLAALNRETSGLIPLMVAAAILQDDPRGGFRRLLPAATAASVFALVFLGVRLLYPGHPLYVPYDNPLGLRLMQYNLTRSFTLQQLMGTLGMTPIFAALALPGGPRLWRLWFLVIIPIWFAVHAFGGVMAETRLFLTPQALVFIPGLLFLIERLANRKMTDCQVPSPRLHSDPYES